MATETQGHGVDTMRANMDGERRCEVCGRTDNRVRLCDYGDYEYVTVYTEAGNPLVTPEERRRTLGQTLRCADHQHGMERDTWATVIEFVRDDPPQTPTYLTLQQIRDDLARANEGMEGREFRFGWASLTRGRLTQEGARSWGCYQGTAGKTDWCPGDEIVTIAYGMFYDQQDIFEAEEHWKRMVANEPDDEHDGWWDDIAVSSGPPEAIDLRTLTDEQFLALGVHIGCIAY